MNKNKNWVQKIRQVVIPPTGPLLGLKSQNCRYTKPFAQKRGQKKKRVQKNDVTS